jgi:hypothetical protein
MHDATIDHNQADEETLTSEVSDEAGGCRGSGHPGNGAVLAFRWNNGHLSPAKRPSRARPSAHVVLILLTGGRRRA